MEGEMISTKMCNCCKSKPAEPGMSTCWDCYVSTKEAHKARKRREAVKTEKNMRSQPEESIDDIARKAREAGMSYGKYLIARAAGRVK
ncbi:MAG: hypothetical protein IK115_07770 [Lachnospiraceae bacterium]|nr:hypothetical protein [Lachnospiraceae bacterium]